MDMPPVTLEQAQALYQGPAYVQVAERSGQSSQVMMQALMAEQNEASRARSQALFDTALGLGIKTGIDWQLRNIRLLVAQQQRTLDTIYDFESLMIQGRVVPPVIIEARDLYNQEGDHALRLSGAYYKIESQARFSSVAPSWREYLTFPSSSPAPMGFDMMKPKNSAEEKLWKQAVADGWRQGVEQANVMLEHGMDRLNRDFTGMLRFHGFVLQDKITMPIIASESIPVINDGSTMTVDETLLRITSLSEFDGDMSKWLSLTPSAAPHTEKKKPWITSVGKIPAPASPAQVFPVTREGVDTGSNEPGETR